MKVQIHFYLMLLALGVVSLSSCDSSQKLYVSHQNEIITYSGRLNINQEKGIDLHWSGSSIKIDFEGDSLFAILQDERSDNYFNVIIDHDSVRLLYLDTTKTSYLLAANLPAGKHTVELFKRTEWDRGKTSFYGFEVIGTEPKVSKSEGKSKKMEFYGNSITAGYAVDDLSGSDSPDSTYTNHYVSYASIVARYFDADYHSICKSGIGVLVSWFPMIMPEMYDRTNPADSASLWDFSKYTPDVVVVNLFQNDSWLIERPEYSEFKARFGTEKPSEEKIKMAYQNFVSDLRNKYPAAHIVCLLGNMEITKEGSPWPNYVKGAVDELQDEKIYTHTVPYKETAGHPNRAEQQALAESLISFINTNIEW